MSVGREEARAVDGTANVDGAANVAPPLCPSDISPVNGGNLDRAELTERVRGVDGRGIGYRVWDFWVRRSWMLWVLAVVVLVLDQSTKSVIVAWLDWGESWPAEGFLRLTHARNTGTAFSLFQGHSNILSIVAVFAVGVLLWVYATTGAKSFVLRLALGLQLGGALGNLLDRLRQGYVTDFLDVGPWPIFNVADSAISVGMVLMVWYFFSHREEDARTATHVSNTSQVVTTGCRTCAEATRYGTLERSTADVSETDIRT